MRARPVGEAGAPHRKRSWEALLHEPTPRLRPMSGDLNEPAGATPATTVGGDLSQHRRAGSRLAGEVIHIGRGLRIPRLLLRFTLPTLRVPRLPCLFPPLPPPPDGRRRQGRPAGRAGEEVEVPLRQGALLDAQSLQPAMGAHLRIPESPAASAGVMAILHGERLSLPTPSPGPEGWTRDEDPFMRNLPWGIPHP